MPRSACLAWGAALLLGCAHGGEGVVVTMTRVSVTPTPDNNPGARWDEGKQGSDDEDCELLVALDFVAPGLGMLARNVCSFSSRSGGADSKPEDPDLFVAFAVGSTLYESPVIYDRASHDLSYALFIPREALRDADLRVAIYDFEGADAPSALIGDHEISRGELSETIDLRGEDLGEPSLERLRLEVADPPGPQTVSPTIAANAGLVAMDTLVIPAGMLVEVRAKGSYRIGDWNDATLGPSGYPGGGPRDFNLPGDSFGAAKHGAAVALLQRDSAAQPVVVGECVQFVAGSGGTLYLGVNDRDYQNNSGELSFEVRVTTPDAAAWAQRTQAPCDN